MGQQDALGQQPADRRDADNRVDRRLDSDGRGSEKTNPIPGSASQKAAQAEAAASRRASRGRGSPLAASRPPRR